MEWFQTQIVGRAIKDCICGKEHVHIPQPLVQHHKLSLNALNTLRAGLRYIRTSISA